MLWTIKHVRPAYGAYLGQLIATYYSTAATLDEARLEAQDIPQRLPGDVLTFSRGGPND